MAASSNPNGLRVVLPNAGGGFAVQGSEIFAGTIADDNLAANTLTSASISKGLIQTATVTVTSAQIKTLYSAPTQIIAAPGSGLTIVMLGGVVKANMTATQYTGGGTFVLQYDSTVHGAGVTPLTTFANTVIQSASTTIQQLQPAAGTVLASNKGIYASCDTADFATGTGTLTVIVTYQVVSA